MVSSNKKKPSVNSQPNTAALVTVVGSELDFYTNSNYLAYQLPQYAAALNEGRLAGDNLEDPEGELGDEETQGDIGAEGDGDTGDETSTKLRPSLADVEIVSNEVVLDAANIPSAKVVFKVKNSSGVELKSIFVRVEKK